jgi:hypothetical protein
MTRVLEDDDVVNRIEGQLGRFPPGFSSRALDRSTSRARPSTPTAPSIGMGGRAARAPLRDRTLRRA